MLDILAENEPVSNLNVVGFKRTDHFTQCWENLPFYRTENLATAGKIIKNSISAQWAGGKSHDSKQFVFLTEERV